MTWTSCRVEIARRKVIWTIGKHSWTPMTDWTATRAEGEKILAAFTPRMGRRYANGRNSDHGSGRHTAVSMLSPYIRRRLVLEFDVVAAALAAHGPEGAEKFVQEVIWRAYFKGWMEHRPQVWESYVHGLQADLSALDRDRRLRRDVHRAMDGQTGLAYFDAWAEELVDTGYLHNHARMWFASIWIFTLGLPWRLGADFFYRHLLDGDPASNTLGWRWVCGLHTKGKTYLARASNIERLTGARFHPQEQLATRAEALNEVSNPPRVAAPDFGPPATTEPYALLVTTEDCHPESLPLDTPPTDPARDEWTRC